MSPVFLLAGVSSASPSNFVLHLNIAFAYIFFIISCCFFCHTFLCTIVCLRILTMKLNKYIQGDLIGLTINSAKPTADLHYI